MNLTEAIEATKNGAKAVCISIVITTIVGLFAIISDAEGKYAFYNDPLIFLDVALMLLLAYGIYKKSRAASVSMFLYLIASQIIVSMETHSQSGIIMSLIFLYFYGKAIQGSFVYHKLKKEENPDYKAAPKWVYIFGIPSLLITIVLFAFVTMSVTGIVPSMRVLSADEIASNNIETLISNDIIYAEDEILYFYSYGLISILEGGSVLTKDRVIIYYTNEDNELEIYEIPSHEITDVSLVTEGDSFTDSEYRVTGNTPDLWLSLSLSTEMKGDKKFIKSLRNTVKEATHHNEPNRQ